jgi:uncharacterized membrane protein YgcG
MPPAPRKRSKRWVAPTYGAATLVFAGALGGIAAQVHAGEDPALGAPVAEASIPQPHYVVTRRVVRKRIVVRRVRDLPPLATTAPVAVAAAPAAGGGGYAAPAYSAPAYSAPASGGSSGGGGSSSSSAPASAPAAAAPAPASVPAPVTRAS